MGSVGEMDLVGEMGFVVHSHGLWVPECLVAPGECALVRPPVVD